MESRSKGLGERRPLEGRLGRRELLIACGMVPPLLYIAADWIAGLRWEGYSFRDQTISELNANGAPTREVTIVLGLAGYAFMMVFGAGLLILHGRRPVRVAGAALFLVGLVSLWAVPFASMNMRGTEQGAAGARHLIGGAVVIPLLLMAMASGAMAFGRVFRLYTIATVVVFVVFGMWAGLATGSRIEDGLETPWAGVVERVSVYAYQLWLAVFAAALLRRSVAGQAREEAGDRATGAEKGGSVVPARAEVRIQGARNSGPDGRSRGEL